VTEAVLCPLCSSARSEKLSTTGSRRYYLCQHCQLIFLDSKQHPLPGEESSRYLEHHNSPEEDGYVQFLYKAIGPMLAYLHPYMQGLDYGCGHTPVLSQLIVRHHRMNCHAYDPFFFPDLPYQPFDYVFSTETFEHFFTPAHAIDHIVRHMKRGAYLCIMTQLRKKVEAFDRWWYRRDPTHVCFYHRQTVAYIAKHWSMKILYEDGSSVFVLQKC